MQTNHLQKLLMAFIALLLLTVSGQRTADAAPVNWLPVNLTEQIGGVPIGTVTRARLSQAEANVKDNLLTMGFAYGNRDQAVADQLTNADRFKAYALQTLRMEAETARLKAMPKALAEKYRDAMVGARMATPIPFAWWPKYVEMREQIDAANTLRPPGADDTWILWLVCGLGGLALAVMLFGRQVKQAFIDFFHPPAEEDDEDPAAEVEPAEGEDPVVVTATGTDGAATPATPAEVKSATPPAAT